MTKSELELLNVVGEDKERPISVLDLDPFLKDRTLLYGYTCNRDTFHVYIKAKKIHVIVYQNDYSQENVKPKNVREIHVTSNRNYVPDKRLYPERCDYRFCEMLMRRDIKLPFTAWTDDVEKKDFYGFTLEDAQ